jgi:UDPglucose--hexose-1-phosphate uridylyltransferase
MSTQEITAVINTWITEYNSLIAQPDIHYVQIFENKGSVMGCSNPHPHGQIWATSTVPNEPSKEITQFKNYNKQHNSCLLCDYAKQELSRNERIIFQNSHFVVLVPFWAGTLTIINNSMAIRNNDPSQDPRQCNL